jgi:hypothetical protein
MRRIANVKRDTLTEFVLDHVARGSDIRTDAWTGYDDIGRYRFKHVVTSVSATGDPHTLLSRMCTSSPRWSSGGSSALTKERSVTRSWTATSTSSPSVSTADAHDSEACSSTDSSRVRWQRIPGRTSS